MADTAKTTCPNCGRLAKRITEVEAQRAQAVARIEQLEALLRQNSQNSSKPPSSDPPSAPAPPAKKKSKRKRGGQPGHPGHFRSLLPTEEVDRVIPVKPDACGRCGRKLRGEDPAPQRRQVWDLPPVRPQVDEYQLHTLGCEHCGAATTAPLPEGVPAGAFGPRTLAMVALLSGAYRLSKRAIERILADFFQMPMSLGAIPTCEKVVSAALAEPVAEARAYVETSEVAYCDETGWKENNKKAWLWTAVTGMVTVFMIHASRGREAARLLLGCFAGVLVSDRWHAYNMYQGLRQLCWAHLIRDFTAFSEYSGKAGRIGEQLLEKAELMFHWWHRIRDGTLQRKTFTCRMKSLRTDVERLLGRGTSCGQAKVKRACKRILKLSDALWTFVDVEGVEPTNNAAERAARKGVLWRKVSFGTQSAEGSRFAERILTAAATCRQQGRNVLEYITEACHAQLHGRPAPSLLPYSEDTLAQSA